MSGYQGKELASNQTHRIGSVAMEFVSFPRGSEPQLSLKNQRQGNTPSKSVVKAPEAVVLVWKQRDIDR